MSGVNLYSQKCQWAQEVVGTGKSYSRNDYPASLAVDVAGNVYMAVNFNSPTLNFNNGDSITNTGLTDVCIAKFNANGVCQWAQKIGGTRDDVIFSIAIDPTGNIYTAGYFRSPTLYFNNGVSLKINNSDDVYIAKYNSNGICQWAQEMSGAGDEYNLSLTLDYSGNIYGTGFFDSPTLNFNNGVSLTNSGARDGYLVKYNSSGICQWAQIIGGTSFESVASIAIDSVGNLYVSGSSIGSTINFNNGISVTNPAPEAIFIAKYNSSGLCQWAEIINGDSNTNLPTLATDSYGAVYIFGSFKSPTLNFNNGISIQNVGYQNGYVAKYNSSGVCQWAQAINGKNSLYANNITIDAKGAVYVTGSFQSPTLNFKNGVTLTNIGQYDGYVAKYDSSGTCQWAQAIAGTSYDYSSSLALDSLSNLYVAGSFVSSQLNFNNGIALMDPNPDTNPIFLAKYDSLSPISYVSGEPIITNSIFIKPNPATNSIVISGAYPDAKANIYNDLGVLVAPVTINSQTGESFEQRVDVSALPCGTYRIVIESQGKTINGAFGVVR